MQPNPEHNDRKPVVDSLVELLNEAPDRLKDGVPDLIAALQKRKQLGIDRYGVALQAFNGRDVITDLREEVLDALIYCAQAREEGFPVDTLLGVIISLATYLVSYFPNRPPDAQ